MKRINLLDTNISTTQRRERIMELSGIPITKTENYNEFDELIEILKEMGYPKENKDEVKDENLDFGDTTKEGIKELVRKIISDMEHDLDINEIIENLTK